MTQELIDAKVFTVAAYQPFYAQLVELEKQNTSLVFDYESKKGNEAARSHVHALRKSKAALEKTRKDEKAESLRIGKAIDSEAKEIEARIEAMIAVHQVKIDEIEQREKDRVAAIKERLDAFQNVGAGEGLTSDEIKYSIGALEALPIDDSFQEFALQAAQLKDARLIQLRAQYESVLAIEVQAAENLRLKKELAEREQKERDEKIAQEAAAKALREAEARQQQEREAAARAIAEAEAKAKADREAAERRELQLKLEAENAERRRVEAEQKAAQDAIDAAAKAEADKAAAILAETARIEAIAKAKAQAEKEAKEAEERAQAKREANKRHCASINNAAMNALIAGGIAEDMARLCVTLIAQGKVPAVTIQY